MPKVFLSYGRRDGAIATKLRADLEAAGISVWSDANLQPGENWFSQISSNLQSAAAVVVILSPESITSRWVSYEWRAALAGDVNQGAKRIIPILTGGLKFSELPVPFAHIQGLSLDEDYDGAVRRLVEAIDSLEQSEAPPLQATVDIERIAEAVEKRIAARLGLQQGGKTSVRRPSISVDEKLVFVVISFDASMDPAFEAICAAAKACGLVAKRVKDVLGDYRITDKMLAMIASARFIVADLSLERPNVYFELGYARGLGKRVITILRDGSSAHFDVQDWQYLAYADSRPLEKDLADRFRYELQRREEDD